MFLPSPDLFVDSPTLSSLISEGVASGGQYQSVLIAVRLSDPRNGRRNSGDELFAARKPPTSNLSTALSNKRINISHSQIVIFVVYI